MKRIFLGIIVFAFLYSLPTKTILSVEGMTCGSGCAPKVNKAALEINGVESCDVNFDESKATLIYDNDKVTELEILSNLQLNTTFKFALSKADQSSKGADCAKKTCSKKTCSSKTKQIEKKSFFQRLFGF
tara:strand:- start:866 stop:1255 length:390 start_codon:yes stop_codon:yes gene_type:complete